MVFSGLWNVCYQKLASKAIFRPRIQASTEALIYGGDRDHFVKAGKVHMKNNSVESEFRQNGQNIPRHSHDAKGGAKNKSYSQ